MANLPATLPLFNFEALSLGSEELLEQQHGQSPGPRLSPAAVDLSFGSPASDSGAPARGAFVFGDRSPPSYFGSPSPPPLSRVQNSGIVFRFGGGIDDASASSTANASSGQNFTFRTLHNVTPQPSPSPSREASPQPLFPQLQSPINFTPAPLGHTPRSASLSNPQGRLLSPQASSTPPSMARFRSLSAASSSPWTPGQEEVLTPGTNNTNLTPPTAQLPSPATPYDARDEPAPSHALFTAVFQNALKDGSKIAKNTATAIEELTEGGGLTELDNDLTRFLEDAKRLQRFQSSNTRTVAILGDSGQGKSSLINSLLHFPDVAETGDVGSACTSVVTEYRQKKAQHVAPITIEAEYLSVVETRELIRELLWSYRQLFLPGVESEDTPEKDYARYTRESEHAWSALQAAFKHKGEFNQAFAQDMSEGALERITDRLVRWASEIEWPDSSTDGFWTSTAQTAAECVKHTKVFMQDRYWPFTKIIRVYLNSQVLKTGIVLADLPGLQDTNLARVRATQDYLIKCDNIIIVANITRAISDQSLKSSLFFVLARHVPTEWEQSSAQKFKIAVVCTKSDEINLSTAKTRLCGPNKRIPAQVMTELDNEIEAAKSSGDRTRKKAAKKRQELLLVQARNDHVRENLQNVYASEMDGKSLRVFCVSNKWYEKYCPKGNGEFVHASEIPELRRFCHTITAEAQLGEAKHYLKAQLSTLLNSLDLWASRKQSIQEETATLDDSIFQDLDKVVDEIPNLVDRFLRDFSTCFQEQIMESFARREENWKLEASIEGKKWMDWHWTQYNAWCHNNGDHQTHKRGYENWNSKIIWRMRMELDLPWNMVEEEASDVLSAMLDDAKSHLMTFKADLLDSTPSKYLDRLAQTIDCQIRDLEYRLNREEESFLGEVRAIRRYASESNYSSYILQDMIPVYRSAASQNGTGRAARQTAIVQGYIEDGVLFPQLSITLATNMNDLIRTTAVKLEVILNDVLGRIRRDLDIVFRSQSQMARRPTARDEEKEARMIKFANEVKALKQMHENALRSIQSL